MIPKMLSRARPSSGFPLRRPRAWRGTGRLRLVLAHALACLFLAACQPGSRLPPLPAAAGQPYRLDVDDQVRIITYGQDNLTGQFRVNDRGEIAIPLLGALKATGLTTAQLERAVEKRLTDQKILTDPKVAVELMAYRPIFVLGEVAKPGQYPYQPNMTVLTAVAVAGGFTYRAQTGYASIVRTTDHRVAEGRVTRDTPVEPDDVVNIFQRYY